MNAKHFLPIVLALASGVSAQATIWDAGADLVANEAPNGPQELINPNPTVPEWSYGYRLTLESTALTLFTSGDHSGASDAFQGFNFNTAIVAVNTIASPQLWPATSVPVLAHEIFNSRGWSNRPAFHCQGTRRGQGRSPAFACLWRNRSAPGCRHAWSSA